VNNVANLAIAAFSLVVARIATWSYRETPDWISVLYQPPLMLTLPRQGQGRCPWTLVKAEP
jgi:hypothetical protein